MPSQISPANRLVAVVAVSVLSTVALAAFAPLTAQSGSRPDLATLTDRLDHDEPLILSAYDVPGVAIAVVRDGEAVWSAGYGVASLKHGTDMTADTVFQVASISKTLTAWGVMHLVETGKVSLDAPIEDYLTRWALPPSAYDSAGVTVERVLSHTAGLNKVDYFPLPGDQPLPSIEESLSGDNGGGQSLRIDLEPGQQFNYSGGGYTLLQLLIEEVSGQRFSDYMQAVILDPLGMVNSTFDPDRVPSQATGHYPNGDPLPHYRLTEQAAAGLYSTANDLALFMATNMPGPNGQVVGRGVLTSESVHTMMARRDMPDGSIVSLGYMNGNLDDGLETTGHTGLNPGWITSLVMIPELGEGILILTNSHTGSISLTLRTWRQWLGVSQTFSTQNADTSLDELRTIMLGGAALILTGVLAVLILTTVQARRGHRRWLWRTGPSGSRRFLIRGAAVAVTIGGLAAFLVWPERMEYVVILPAEAATVHVALALAAGAIALLASTRRVSS